MLIIKEQFVIIFSKPLLFIKKNFISVVRPKFLAKVSAHPTAKSNIITLFNYAVLVRK